MSSLLLRNARLLDPGADREEMGDLLIVDGKVRAVGPEAAKEAPPGVPTLDARGRVACPGLIDVHVHLREPGQSAKETLQTGGAAALRGGFTTVVCMPNTQPPLDNASAVRWVRERAEAVTPVHVLVAGAITKGLGGEELAPIGALHQAGVVAITDDGRCVQNHELMLRAVQYAGMFGLPVMDHCQDDSLVTDGVMHEGLYSTILGLRGWPAEGEELIVARNILLAERTGVHIHCQHVSTAGSVRLLREAQARGVPISGEACPHHFTLTDAAVAGSETFWSTDGKALYPDADPRRLPHWDAFDTHLKMNPPLRSADDRKAVIEAVMDGVLSVIASDHAPHTNYEKEVEFDHAPFGIIGMETELGLALTHLHHRGGMPLRDLVARFTSGPARLLGLDGKGTLRPGADGDITLIDPDLEWTPTPAATASKARNCPFYGWPLQGRAVATIIGGKVAWKLEEDVLP